VLLIFLGIGGFMRSLVAASVVLAFVFTGGLAGLAIRRVVPRDLLDSDVKDTVRVAISLVVTMTGFVLGMLVSTATTYYNSQKRQVVEMASEIIVLNDLFKSYGPEADQARISARLGTEKAADTVWPKEKSQLFQLRPQGDSQEVIAQVQLLVPKNTEQASIKSQIPPLISKLDQTYWLLFLDSEEISLSIPMLIVVTAWLTAIFVSFGVFALPKSSVIVTLIVCALAVSAFAAFRLMRWNNWFYEGLGTFLQSSQQSISGQTTFGGGVGRFLKNTNLAHISVLVGFVGQNANYQNKAVPQNLTSGLIAANVQLFRFNKTNMNVTAALLPIMSQPGRVKFTMHATYSLKLRGNLSWNVSLYNNWDSQPPNGLSGSDYGSNSGLSWTFGNK
jgi:Protein of unknown function, DUF481